MARKKAFSRRSRPSRPGRSLPCSRPWSSTPAATRRPRFSKPTVWRWKRSAASSVRADRCRRIRRLVFMIIPTAACSSSIAPLPVGSCRRDRASALRGKSGAISSFAFTRGVGFAPPGSTRRMPIRSCPPTTSSRSPAWTRPPPRPRSIFSSTVSPGTRTSREPAASTRFRCATTRSAWHGRGRRTRTRGWGRASRSRRPPTRASEVFRRRTKSKTSRS